jgi:hypothetical protein
MNLFIKPEIIWRHCLGGNSIITSFVLKISYDRSTSSFNTSSGILCLHELLNHKEALYTSK